jgi:hypothetical protein
LASAAAKQRSASLSPFDVDVEEAADETPPDGAAPHASVVKTTMALKKIEWWRNAFFTDPTLSPFPHSRNPVLMTT